MQSLQRFQILVSNRPIFPAKSSNLRQIFFTGGKWTGRGGSSRLQPSRRVELTPAEPNILPEGNGHLIGPIFFTAGVRFSVLFSCSFFYQLLDMLFIIKFTGSCLSLAAIWEYENMRKKALQFRQKATGWIQRQQNLKHVTNT